MKKRIISFLLIMIMVFSLSGCNTTKKIQSETNKKNNTVNKQEKKKIEKNIAGTYTLIEMKGESQSYTKEDLKTLKDNGLEVKLELKEDKTAVLDLFGTKQDLKYDSNYFYSGEEKITYSYDNGILKLVNNNQSLTFELKK